MRQHPAQRGVRASSAATRRSCSRTGRGTAIAPRVSATTAAAHPAGLAPGNGDRGHLSACFPGSCCPPAMISTPITRSTPIAEATSGWPCSMPRWYISSTGDADLPFGPPPLVSRYGSVNRLAPVMMASSVTSVVAGPYAGDGDGPEAAPPRGAVDRRRLVELLRHVLQRGQVEQDEEPELLPGDEDGDRRHRPARVDQPGRVGAALPRTWLTSPSELNRNSHTADDGHAGRDVRDVEADPEEGPERDRRVQRGGQQQRQPHGQRHVDDQEDQDVQERLADGRVGQHRGVVVEPDEGPGHADAGRGEDVLVEGDPHRVDRAGRRRRRRRTPRTGR